MAGQSGAGREGRITAPAAGERQATAKAESRSRVCIKPTSRTRASTKWAHVGLERQLTFGGKGHAFLLSL